MPKKVNPTSTKPPATKKKKKKSTYDPELLAAITAQVQQLSKEVLGERELPQGVLTGIAKQAIHARKLDDAEWITQRLQKAGGIDSKPKSLSELKAILKAIAVPSVIPDYLYLRRFPRFSRTAYQIFCEMFGEKAFEFMLEVLENPYQASPRWASQFMATVMAIGSTMPPKADAYHYITQHEKWSESKQLRKQFCQRLESLQYRAEIKRAYLVAKQEATQDSGAPQVQEAKEKATASPEAMAEKTTETRPPNAPATQPVNVPVPMAPLATSVAPSSGKKASPKETRKASSTAAS